MKQFKADSAVTLHPGSKVGLTIQQFTPRAHNLARLGETNGIVTCNVIRPIQFKIGEVFFTEELPKSMASQVKAEGEGAESGADGDENQEGLNFADMSVPQLKEFLAAHDVEIPKGAKKPALVKLAESVPVDADEEETADDAEPDEGDDEYFEEDAQ